MKSYDEVVANVLEGAAAHRRKVKRMQQAAALTAMCAVCIVGLSVYRKLESPPSIPADPVLPSVTEPFVDGNLPLSSEATTEDAVQGDPIFPTEPVTEAVTHPFTEPTEPSVRPPIILPPLIDPTDPPAVTEPAEESTMPTAPSEPTTDPVEDPTEPVVIPTEEAEEPTPPVVIPTDPPETEATDWEEEESAPMIEEPTEGEPEQIVTEETADGDNCTGEDPGDMDSPEVTEEATTNDVITEDTTEEPTEEETEETTTTTAVESSSETTTQSFAAFCNPLTVQRPRMLLQYPWIWYIP